MKGEICLMIEAVRDGFSRFMPPETAKLLAPLVLLFGVVALLTVAGLLLVRHKKIKRDTLTFYGFISPWLIGFFIFSLYPLIYSIFISFHKWDLIGDMKFIGIDNYVQAFSGKDKWFYQSLKVTLYYTFLSVPLQLIVGFCIALLMNQKVRGMNLFRTIFYMPSLVSGVALSTLWLYIFNYNFGLLNNVLGLLGIAQQKWLLSPGWVIPSLVLMSLWGVGGNMVVYLAGLQDVPQDIYEAASIDGAGAWSKFKNVTIPMMSPIIFFNLIMGIIGSFQTFTQSFIMTEGGPNGASMFYVLNLYQQAFKKFNMGYASALAWILFIIILAFTALIFKSSNLWVFYETEVKQKRAKKQKTAKEAL